MIHIMQSPDGFSQTPLRLALTALAVGLLATVAGSQSAKAQTYTVLHSFKGVPDGVDPRSDLMLDAKSGSIYGTTFEGGAYGYGAVFKVDNGMAETVLYSFCAVASCDDGTAPSGRIVRDVAGNIYGATAGGGAYNYGSVFQLDKGDVETVLYSFTGRADGYAVNGGLVRDAAGNLYGTTYFGGSSDYGTVFRVDRAGKKIVLHSFGGSDGAYPDADLLRDTRGNLYGTTSMGGSHSSGTVFKLDAKTNFTVLYDFTGTDGYLSAGTLIMDVAGNLYGTTLAGGLYGRGNAFRLSRTGKLTTLHSFHAGGDGGYPMAGLVSGPGMRKVYGTTYFAAGKGCGGIGCGTVFEIDTKTHKTKILHRFTGGADGGNSFLGFSQRCCG
jgi:uncharacterized repeat protein (TIGR03803 family)